MMRSLARWHRLLICAAALAVAAGWHVWTPAEAAGPPTPAVDDRAPNALCLICHDEPGLTTTSLKPPRAIEPVDPSAFARSAHGEESCVDCHESQSALPHPRSETTGQLAVAIGCASCHQEAYDGYLESPHGTMAELHDARGPACADCHGNVHAMEPIASWTEEERAEVCAGCHPGAGTGFLSALSHEEPSPTVQPTAYFAGRFLVVLASGALAFGIIHVELDLLRWIVRRWRTGSGRTERWESM